MLHIFLKGDLQKYNPQKLRNEVLADDVRILAAWWATGVKDRQLIVNLLRKILVEIARRKREGRMKWTLRWENQKHPDLFKAALKGLKEVQQILEGEVEAKSSKKGRLP